MGTRRFNPLILVAFLLLSSITGFNVSAQDSCSEAFSYTHGARAIDSATQFDQTGYSDEVSKVDFSSGHTLNLDRYLARNLGQTAGEVSKTYDRFLILAGDPVAYEEAIARQGLGRLDPVPKSYGTHTLFRTVDREGKNVLVIANLHVREQVLRSQLLLSAAGVAGGRVQTFGRIQSMKPSFLETFRAMGPPPDIVIYGFAGTILKKVLSLNPFAIRNRLKFSWAAYQKRNLSHSRPYAQEPFYSVTLADGTRIWLLTNVYGEGSKDMFEALADHGVKKMFALGTAGSLSTRVPVGKLFTPSSVATEGTDPVPARLAPFKSSLLTGVYAKVLTPLIETKAWLTQKIGEGVDAVDVELGHIMAAHRAHPNVRLSAAFLISDIMVGDHGTDLSQWTTDRLDQSADTIFSFIGNELGRTTANAWSLKKLDVHYRDGTIQDGESAK